MTVTLLVGDIPDQAAKLAAGSVDLVFTSSPAREEHLYGKSR